MALTINPTDYLSFNAASIKSLIIQKLNEDGIFSDQLYEGSNLSIIIDVFSYIYSLTTFQINNAATEAIFSDAQIYENINRIVKMLGYNPQGFFTSTALGTLGIKDGLTYDSPGIVTIPKFTTIETDLTDETGIPISYSFIENYAFVINSDSTIDSIFQPTLYNGKWKVYSQLFKSSGIPFETFLLNQLDLSSTNRIYIAHNQIYVYLKLEDGTYEEYSPTTNLFNSLGTDKNFEVRIDENKQYTIKFGDNINGKQIPANAELYIIYLQSNGTAGQIGAGQIKPQDNTLTVSIDGLSEAFIKDNILKISTNPEYIKFGSDANAQLQKISITNTEATTTVKDFETVEEIRTNAPNKFRSGSRLVTAQDYKQYILTNYSTEVYDTNVMNNYEYMVQFQQWLKSYNKLTVDIKHYDYEFTDSCDFNNIYLWVKSYGINNVTKSAKRLIERDMDRIKCVTSELVFLDPFLLNFSPCLNGSYNIFDYDPNNENVIELIRDRNTLITTERIKQRAVTIIQDFFSLKNCSLGMTIDINSLYNSLMGIDGVKLVRTKYKAYNSPESTAQFLNGLSFACWTPHILLGADITKITGNFKLQNFQFPNLLNTQTIANKISVTSDSYSITEVEY